MMGVGSLRTTTTGMLLALAVSLPVYAADPSLGIARGTRRAEVSVDGGTRWLAIGGGRSMPLLDGLQIRTVTGVVRLELTDGSLIQLRPFGAASVEGREGGRMHLYFRHGHLVFDLPAATRVAIETSTAGFQPVRVHGSPEPESAVGEAWAGTSTAIRVARGSLAVDDRSGARRVLPASPEPVFVPARPADSEVPVTTDVSVSASREARPVFDRWGESAGYLSGGRLVVHPGVAADLARPFPARLVELATNSMPPDAHQAQAEPLFDGHGAYVGYVARSLFFEVEARAPADDRAADRGGRPAASVKAPTALATGVPLDGAATAAGFDRDDPPATPINP